VTKDTHTPGRPRTTRPPSTSRAASSQVYTHRNRTVAVPAGYLAVGYIQGVHGLHGELKVELFTDFPERFVSGTELLMGEVLTVVKITGARLHKQHLLLQLEGVNRREEAEALRGEWLFVNEADAVALDEGVYWVHDIIGLDVQTEEGDALGVVREVLFTGANEVYVIETPPGINRGRDLLLPAIEEVVRKVDLAAGCMTVHLLPGLVEEESTS
jgi:16S rRNA processing protein RimM